MDSIDYRGALTRGWRLLVALAVVGLIIGLILPTSGAKSQWASYSSVGSAPPALAQSSVLSPGVTTDQILFYASADATLLEAGKLAHSSAPLFVIRSSIQVQGPGTTSSGATTGQAGVVNVKVVAPTIQQSVDLNNGFDAALAFAVNAAAQQAVTNEQHQIESTIATIDQQLYSQQFPAGVTATALEAQLSALQSRLATLAVTPTDTGYVVLQPALPYTVTRTKVPVTDSRLVRGLIGLLAGVILGVIVVLAASFFDKRLRTAKATATAFGYPVVAAVPDGADGRAEVYRKLWLAVFREPLPEPPTEADPWVQEAAFDLDRLDVVPARPEQPRPLKVRDAHAGTRQVVLVASPGSEPTRAAVAADLATACAEAGQRVTVVSTVDLEAAPTDQEPSDDTEPTHGNPGVAVDERLLSGPVSQADVRALLEETSVPGVSLLALRHFVPGPAKVVERVDAVVASLRNVVDVVIVEVPSFVDVHHGEGLAPSVDVIVVVAESRATRSDRLQSVGSSLKRLGAPVVGVVLTGIDAPIRARSTGRTEADAPSVDEDLDDDGAAAVGASELERDHASEPTGTDGVPAGRDVSGGGSAPGAPPTDPDRPGD